MRTQIRDINTAEILAESTEHDYTHSVHEAAVIAEKLFHSDTSAHPAFVYWVCVDSKGYAIHRGAF